MHTITVEIGIKQIETAIRRLNPQDKIRLIETLEKETWPDRFKALLKRIDTKVQKFKLPEKEINQVCEEVRHKHHAYRRPRH